MIQKAVGAADYLLVNVCYRVHPAECTLFRTLGGVAEFMDDTDMIGVGTTK